MFSLAIFIGIYSYIIVSLGLVGLWYKEWILVISLAFVLIVLYYYRSKIFQFRFRIGNSISRIFIALIVIQALVNFVGALGPELSFDALWYHLTLPKIFLESHSLIHIPGGLLYASDMPKLIEMLYLPALALSNEIVAKTIHFLFGLLTTFAIYGLSRKFLGEKFAALASLIFYSNLVVGWQSTTAYIDLARAFFELMALWGIINWNEISANSTAKRGWFIESAIMLGLAISTKLISLATLPIFLLLIIYLRGLNKKNIKNVFLYVCIALYISMPWFLFSYLSTGNPVYPIFTDYIRGEFDASVLSLLFALKTFWILFTHSSDPISPIYIIFLPLTLLFYRKLSYQIKLLLIYSFFSLIFWYVYIPAKESRYLLQIFAALSIVVSYSISLVLKNKLLKNLSFGVIIFVSIISIFYRGIANAKYLPVIFGLESKDHFLTSNLNFDYGDFYDTDRYFSKHIGKNDRVLLYGFHNLYYVNFPFIDSSYVKKGDVFNYIAIRNEKIPDRFKFWELVYSNSKTHVNLYSSGGQKWVY